MRWQRWLFSVRVELWDDQRCIRHCQLYNPGIWDDQRCIRHCQLYNRGAVLHNCNYADDFGPDQRNHFAQHDDGD